MDELNPSIPNVARMYDYYLGGKDNYAADREAAEKILHAAPFTPVLARHNRRFMQRAARHLALSGIRQFLDIGTGLPTQGNVHEVVRPLVPDARVVYVDNDPVVAAHGRALTATDDATIVLRHDMRDTGALLADPALRDAIDLGEPVGLMLLSMLHCLGDDEDPYAAVAALRDALAPGSHVVISHITGDDDVTDNSVSVYGRANTGMTHRSRDRLLAFFDGWTLLEPGLVRLDEWRPEPSTGTIGAGGGYYLCGVGAK
ncbi:SAM-dependent methyltransferase [Actinomadura sp. GTD37]|uniref:SAM-dependent methyltransferase n=1 Tax=Actinomadura sp. GTD37 TaxID=1778030 RepID=UPI0035BFB443